MLKKLFHIRQAIILHATLNSLLVLKDNQDVQINNINRRYY